MITMCASQAEILKGSNCDIIKFRRSGLEMGFALEMEHRPTRFSPPWKTDCATGIYSSVNDPHRTVRQENSITLEGKLVSASGEESGVAYRLELEKDSSSLIGSVCLIGREEDDDRPIRLKFFETTVYDSVLGYHNDPSCYKPPYDETPLVIWRSASKALMTCFGNGNVEPYAFRDRVHSACYLREEFRIYVSRIRLRIPCAATGL